MCMYVRMCTYIYGSQKCYSWRKIFNKEEIIEGTNCESQHYHIIRIKGFVDLKHFLTRINESRYILIST